MQKARFFDTLNRQSVVRAISAATVLGLGDNAIFATANTATDSYTVTLPPVAEADGQLFAVTSSIANSKVVTLADNDDSLGWTDLVLDADGDKVLLYSDGAQWWVVVNGIA